MAVIFNMAVQNGDNAPNGSTVFPLQMEVDWIKVYKRKPCGLDISISNENPFILDPNSKVLNSITGVNVDISRNFTVPTNHQVDVLAEHSITLGAGFSVESGGKFLADIVSSLCLPSSEYKTNNDNNHYTDRVGGEISVFPNPTVRTFTIEIPKGIKDCEINVVNLNGELVYFEKSTGTLIQISIPNVNSGVYIVKVLDTDSGEEFSKKVILK